MAPREPKEAPERAPKRAPRGSVGSSGGRSWALWGSPLRSFRVLPMMLRFSAAQWTSGALTAHPAVLPSLPCAFFASCCHICQSKLSSTVCGTSSVRCQHALVSQCSFGETPGSQINEGWPVMRRRRCRSGGWPQGGTTKAQPAVSDHARLN